MSLAEKPKYSERPFIVAPYFPSADGRLRPRRPDRCVKFDSSSLVCKIVINRWRLRKRGPGHPLAIFWCRPHGVYFTVYPPGWLQYGRAPVIDQSFDGTFPEDYLPGEGSLFQAVIDAAQDESWPILAKGTAPGVYKTQIRHIRGAIGILALAEQSSRRHEEVAAKLKIGLHTIKKSTVRIRDGPPWLARGAEAAAVLRAAAVPGRIFFERIIDLGTALRFWGRARILSADPAVTFVP